METETVTEFDAEKYFKILCLTKKKIHFEFRNKLLTKICLDTDHFSRSRCSDSFYAQIIKRIEIALSVDRGITELLFTVDNSKLMPFDDILKIYLQNSEETTYDIVYKISLLRFELLVKEMEL